MAPPQKLVLIPVDTIRDNTVFLVSHGNFGMVNNSYMKLCAEVFSFKPCITLYFEFSFYRYFPQFQGVFPEKLVKIKQCVKTLMSSHGLKDFMSATLSA